MIWLTTTLVFVGTALICLLLFSAFIPARSRLSGRLTYLWQSRIAPAPSSFAQKQERRFERILAGLGNIIPASEQNSARSRRILVRAGFHRPQSVQVLRGVRSFLPVAFVAFVYFFGLYKVSPPFVLAIAVLAGALAPDFWLSDRVRKRKSRLIRGLPDALDLLVVSVEAGLGLDQAIYRVAQEIFIAHPDLSEELQVVNLEMRIGKGRAEALRDLAERSGIQDIKSLVAILIQTDRFGTDLGRSLRVHSEALRTRRRQRAEEMAAKASVRMIPALVFFIFPAIFVVVLGPAFISLVREFASGFVR